MNSDDELALLLDSWENAQAGNAPVTLAELCGDRLDLLPELERRVAVLRCFDALCAAGDAPTAEFRSHADTPSPHGPVVTAVPQPQADGSEFGGYRLVALLGEGGMGRVYRAIDLVLRREVALKVVRPEIAVDPQARERFLREARLMAAVEHDHVVVVFQVGEVDGVPFLAMPLLKGETLAARLIRERRLPPAEVRRIGREVAAGLTAAHARGLIHRDVKPSNIWLEAMPPGRVKLLDFGLAREQRDGDNVTRHGTVLGTPAYMSPEQADGQPLDHRSDLFSLGTVLYECSTGQRPFQGKTLTALLHAIAQRQCPAPHEIAPSVPVELSGFILRLLAKSPTDRPQSALAVVESLRTIETVAETATYRPQPLKSAPARSPNPQPPKRSRRLAVSCSVSATIAALLLVSVGIGILSLMPAVQKVRSSAPNPSVPVTQPLNVKVDLRVWKKADTSESLEVSAAGALPLQEGDYLRLEVHADRPAYLYVIYLDAGGDAAPWYPWRNFNWDERPPEEKQTAHLKFPEDPLKGEWRLTAGPSGIEGILLLARDEPLSADEVGRLRQLFEQKPPPAKFDPLRAAVWLGAEDRFGNVQDRGRPNLDPTGTVVDPVERIRRLVRGGLKDLAGEVRGVCYPFQGR